MTDRTFSHRRRSIRLPGYDYSRPGAYFVTICTQDRACLFGEIVDGGMRLNDTGRIVDDEWRRSSALRVEIALDTWIVMPNHVHGVVFINAIAVENDRGNRTRVQIRDNKTDQRTTQNPGPCYLAA